MIPEDSRLRQSMKIIPIGANLHQQSIGEMGGREEGATGRATLEGPLKTEVHRSHAHVHCVPGDLCEAYSSRLTAWVPARFLYRLLGLDITIEVRESMAAPTASSDATSGFVWPSSQMLADFLEARMCAKDPAALAGRRVLELGGGTGALGMALSARGAEVTITDLAEQVPHIEANLVRNELLWGHEQRPARRPTVQAHAWGEDIEWLVSSRFDIVIGADLLYFGGWYVFVDVRVYARVSACLYAVARTVQTLYTQGYYEYGHSRSIDAVVSGRGLMLASTF